jgi:hypothetical protein
MILLKKYCEIYIYIYHTAEFLRIFPRQKGGWGGWVEALFVYNEDPFCWEGIIFLR